MLVIRAGLILCFVWLLTVIWLLGLGVTVKELFRDSEHRLLRYIVAAAILSLILVIVL